MFCTILLFSTTTLAQEQNDSNSAPDNAGQMQQAEQTFADDIRATEEAVRSQVEESAMPQIDEEARQPDNTDSMTSEFSSSGSSQTESRSESSSATISAGRPDHNDRRWGNDFPAPPDEAMFGNWTLGEENGNTCTVDLQNYNWFGGYKAYVPAGCPDGFFNANRWVISGNRLLITDSDNRVIGSFWPAGPDRWGGRRASDGARLYLNRR